MKRFQFTIRALVFAVVLVAFDCAYSMAFVVSGSAELELASLGSLPMANALAIMGCRRMVRGTVKSPFFLGFAFTGAVVALGWFVGCLAADDRTLDLFSRFYIGIFRSVPFYSRAQALAHGSTLAIVYIILVGVGCYWILTALPQFLFALAGGWLVARAALVLKRRVPEA